MDILQANFPQRFPRRRTVQQMRDAESFPIRGCRGIANDETNTVERVVQCDEVFLENLILHLEYADLLVLQAGDILNRQSAYETYGGNPLNYNQEVHLREAVTVASKIEPEIERLSKHPELFSSPQRQAQFLEMACAIACQTKEVLQIDDRIRAMRRPVEDVLAESAKRRPVDRETGAVLQPWPSFAHPVNVENVKKRRDWNRLQQEVPGKTLQRANILPASAVLIAQRNKLRADSLLRRSQDPSPESWALVHTTDSMLWDVNLASEHVSSMKRPIPPTGTEEQRYKNTFAWGKQERAAEMARFMAHYCREVISLPGQPRPPGAFLGTFRDAEGMRELKQKIEAVKTNKGEE